MLDPEVDEAAAVPAATAASPAANRRRVVATGNRASAERAATQPGRKVAREGGCGAGGTPAGRPQGPRPPAPGGPSGPWPQLCRTKGQGAPGLGVSLPLERQITGALREGNMAAGSRRPGSFGPPAGRRGRRRRRAWPAPSQAREWEPGRARGSFARGPASPAPRALCFPLGGCHGKPGSQHRRGCGLLAPQGPPGSLPGAPALGQAASCRAPPPPAEV